MQKNKNRIAYAFFYLITMLIPFFFEDAYFNMSQAKGHIYMIGSFLLLILAGILCLGGKVKAEKIKTEKTNAEKNAMENRKSVLERWKSLFLYEKSMIIFAGIALISTFSSESFGYSLFGTLGWSIGGYTIVTWVLVYFLLSRWMDYKESRWIIPGVGYLIIFLIGILHSAGIDVLYLHDGIFYKQWYDYLSTIGHKNWYVGFLCLLIPMFAVLFMKEREKKLCIFYGIILESALFNMILCDSDGIYLGLLLCLCFAIFYVMKEQNYLRRAILILLGYGLALICVQFCGAFAPKLVLMDGMSKSLVKSPLGIIIMIASIILWILVGKITLTDSVRGRMAMVICVLCGIVFAGYWVRTAITFDATWGNYRGEIWQASMEAFGKYTIVQKLIGVGPEMLMKWYAELSATRTLVVLVSHSEPIQILLTTGILGFLAWAIAWGDGMRRIVKQRIYLTEGAIFFLPMVAYLGQSLVNSGITTNVMLFCLMTALLRKSLDDSLHGGEKKNVKE